MARKFSSLQEKRTYQCWADMKSRCYNENHKRYKYYEGIFVCKRWKDSFGSFVEDMGLKPGGLSLGRYNKTGDYRPSNCFWATDSQNNTCQSNTPPFTHKGRTQTLEEWAEEVGLPRSTLSSRIHCYGWDIATALKAPYNHKENIPKDLELTKYLPKLDDNLAKEIRDLYGKGWSQADLAREYRVSSTTIHNIVHRLTRARP